ncbi:erythrocyte membrane protein 1 (PfEMP1), exon 2, putative [Plasmodium reichenowi]|uniref:Erythrocyte membrane protein 1 (PfEMP1), exon 2, putative n=1 Tax=Plasmodium reichenowi TaxID=5854 RepID=A0A2P9DSX1_PLARE|nr:erythrocyte membrane protein 1 (PfEMP1), exon 2, putative [Plasmodium reichenowi]
MVIRYLQRNHQIGMSRMNVADINAKHIFTMKEKKQLYINDIYVPGSPKYKSLIEVLLEPSKRDTFNLSSCDISTNKRTDNEWNELKKDFTEQYITYIEPAVPLNHELQTNNIYMYIERNILHVIMDEKPFIISIQDRFLGSGRE